MSKLLFYCFACILTLAHAWISTSISIPTTRIRHVPSHSLAARRQRPDTNKPPPPIIISSDRGNDDVNDQDDTETDKNAVQNLNWLERSFPPTDKDDEEETDAILEYNVGLSGISFETGRLSGRIYAAMTAKQFSSQATGDLRDLEETLRVYAMELAAQEATRVALQQNGLEMVLPQKEEDESVWGSVDSIQLLSQNDHPQPPLGLSYNNWNDAAKHWTPGQNFHFVVRNVPARVMELSLEELLQTLDPDGTLREQGNAMNLIPVSGELQSFKDMVGENRRRVELSPHATNTIFAGIPDKRGYQIITAEALQSCWNNQTHRNDDNDFLESPTVLHVMDALVSHGCLVVELPHATALESLWTTVEQVFASPAVFPPLRAATETGSPYAKVGFVQYETMAFLETRKTGKGVILPHELTAEQQQSLHTAFAGIADVCRNVIRIAMAASALEDEQNNNNNKNTMMKDVFDPFQSADWAVQELVDYGDSSSATVSMSPHRLCRYFSPNNNNNNTDKGDEYYYKEVFGAHTDSTFLTAVPVATVPGLEIYDEAAEQWYRPELSIPRHHHARYVVLVPGEFLQLLTRHEVVASVHRVVVGANERYSAPLLLRGRSDAVWNVSRYFGNNNSPLLQECDGQTMDTIHAAMQQT